MSTAPSGTSPAFSLKTLFEREPEAGAQLSEMTGAADPAAWLTDADNFQMLLWALPPEEFDLFCRAAAKPFWKAEEADCLLADGTLRALCLARSWRDGDSAQYVIVPSELRELWRDLQRTGFAERKKRRDTLDLFAHAAVKLYGALPLKDFRELLKVRAGLTLTDEDRAELATLGDGTGFYMEQDTLLHPSLTIGEAEAYYVYRDYLPPCCPGKDKLFLLGGSDYYDVFRELELWRLEVEEQLRSEGSEPHPEQAALAFADGLYHLLRAETSEEGHEDFFRAFGITPDPDRLRELRPKVHRWILYGNTLEELLQLRDEGFLKVPVNAPCFCGSGKKWKKCHGA